MKILEMSFLGTALFGLVLIVAACGLWAWVGKVAKQRQRDEEAAARRVWARLAQEKKANEEAEWQRLMKDET